MLIVIMNTRLAIGLGVDNCDGCGGANWFGVDNRDGCGGGDWFKVDNCDGCEIG